MRALRTIAIAAALLASCSCSPCDEEATQAVVLAAVGGAKTEGDFGACSESDDEEGCVCAAMRLGWHEAARSAVVSRTSRHLASPAVRQFAQSWKIAASGLLTRLHPSYPRRFKMLPAIVWAQTDEILHVRVRHARYTRGESAIKGIEQGTLQALLTDEGLFYSVEGDLLAGFLQTSLSFFGKLERADGCGDAEESCAKWAGRGMCDDSSARAAAPPAMTEAEAEQQALEPSVVRSRCAQSCGLCAPLNGSDHAVAAQGVALYSREPGVRAAWAHVPEAFVFEARKSVEGRWPRLLESRSPKNRLAQVAEEDAEEGARAMLPGSPRRAVGELLECVEACLDNCEAEAQQLTELEDEMQEAASLVAQLKRAGQPAVNQERVLAAERATLRQRQADARVCRPRCRADCAGSQVAHLPLGAGAGE